MQIPNIDDVNTTEELAKFIETVEKIQDAYLNNLRRERGMEPDSDLSEAMIRSTPLSIIPEFTPRIFGLSVNHDELQHSTLNIRCTR